MSRIDRPVPGHDINDASCVYWRGDFAGVNLNAVCATCLNKNLRQDYGSASSLYRPGKSLWNWLFDTEYTTISGIPPIVPLVVGVALIGAAVALVWGLS